MPTTLTLQPTGQVLHVPTSWADVTLAQFVALFAPVPDEPRTLPEVLLGLEAGALDQLAANDVGYIANLIAFSEDVTPVTELLPTPGLPDVGSLAYGALLLCQQHLQANADRPDLASLPYILSVYRAQLREGKPDRANELLLVLLAAPVTEVYADGAHFLAACRSWQPGRHLTRPMKQSQQMKSLTPTPNRQWLSGLGLRFPWMRSPKAT